MIENNDLWADFGNWGISDFSNPWNESGDLIFGNPAADARDWEHQDTGFTCGVVSEQMILRQFGINASEAELVFISAKNGWLSESGMSPLDVGNLLESYGISTHTNMGGGVEALVNELSHGRKVIAAVDSGELWGQDYFFADWINPNGADHALVITGVDLSNPNEPKVVVNDPGEPNGAGREYPMDQFLDAWQDSGQYYVATDVAPPDLASHAVFGKGFDAENQFYLDPGFWFQVIAAVTAGYTVVEHIISGSEAANTNLWSDLTDQARDHLFISI